MRRQWIALAKGNPKLAGPKPKKPPPGPKTLESALDRFRAICLSFPDTKETQTWEKPHFRVGDKIFAGCGDEADPSAVGFKLTMEHARERVLGDPRFKRAAYVGHKGWVTMDLAGKPDWFEVATLVEESYRLIAKAKSLAKLDKQQAIAPPGKKRGS